MSPSRPDVVLQLFLTCRAALASRLRGGDGERGDVPGWVLVTLMTAGLVTVLWTLAGSTLQTLFTESVTGVTGPGAG